MRGQANDRYLLLDDVHVGERIAACTGEHLGGLAEGVEDRPAEVVVLAGVAAGGVEQQRCGQVGDVVADDERFQPVRGLGYCDRGSAALRDASVGNFRSANRGQDGPGPSRRSAYDGDDQSDRLCRRREF